MNREYWFVTDNNNPEKLDPIYIHTLSDIVNRIPATALPSTSLFLGNYLDVTRVNGALCAQLRKGNNIILKMQRRSVNVPPEHRR